jgi:HSP20 family molecular chaperone IbpA
MNSSSEHKMQIAHYQKKSYTRLFFQHNEIHTLFEELIHKPWGYRFWQPLIDVFEGEDSFRIKVDLPGVGAEQVIVKVSGTRLSIEGCRENEKKDENAEMKISERPRGIFAREIELFETLSDTDIEEQYEDGVLTIVVKKHKS